MAPACQSDTAMPTGILAEFDRKRIGYPFCPHKNCGAANEICLIISISSPIFGHITHNGVNVKSTTHYPYSVRVDGTF
jgi:hypothetical protein